MVRTTILAILLFSLNGFADCAPGSRDEDHNGTCEPTVGECGVFNPDHRGEYRCPVQCPVMRSHPSETGYFCDAEVAVSKIVPASSGATGWGVSCRASLSSAADICNMNKDKDIQAAMAMGTQLKNQVDNAALSNLQLACNGMGNVSKAVNAALAGFQGYCATQQDDCATTCAEDLKTVVAQNAIGKQNPVGATLYPTDADVKEVREMKKQCDGLQQNIQGAQEGVMKFMALDQAMANCSMLTANPFAEQCKKDPKSSPFCPMASTTDCTNASVANTNIVCRCQKPENKGLTECGGPVGSVPTNTQNHSSTNGADGAANLGDFGGPSGGFGGTGADLMAGEASKEAGGGNPLNRGGSGKSSIGESGGTGGKNGGAGGGAGGSNLNAKVIGGYGFGGGAAGGSGGGSAGGGNAGYRQNGNGTVGPNGQKVDLRQFMPGGQRDPSRALAGISGPDGITGPNSDIWQKINTRYFSVTPSLLP